MRWQAKACRFESTYMKTRNTFRRTACLAALEGGCRLLPDLRWHVWASEFEQKKTEAVCPRSTHYRTSFDRSLERLQMQGNLHSTCLNSLDHPITYGLAAKLAVFTVLERGQLTGLQSPERIRLYFGTTWCAVVLDCGDGVAVNLGAVFVTDPSRYRLLSLEPPQTKHLFGVLSDVPWQLRTAPGGSSINPRDLLPPITANRSFYNRRKLSFEEREYRSVEGVALVVRHQYPGGISPYLLPGEWSATTFNSKGPNDDR
jgi:hypothetical protein